MRLDREGHWAPSGVLLFAGHWRLLPSGHCGLIFTGHWDLHWPDPFFFLSSATLNAVKTPGE